jgi:Family of unknown function (DUF6519)
MRGDFSRIRFNRRKNYTAVLEQQGRVALDADANEQVFIDACQSRAETIDAVGQYGGPADNAGFQITITNGNEILIGPGRYYVNGLLCENPANISYDSQPYLTPAAGTASSVISQLNASGGASVLQVWLQVWQRLQTALDDPCLLEPALGRADTTARLQTVWRVVANVAPTPAPPPSGAVPSCCQDMYAAGAPPVSTGTMTAGTSGPAADCGCAPVAAAGYQGIENQLYRVEIHTGTTDNAPATWKWSRENGSVVTAITGVSGSTVQVRSLGPDANLGFQTGQWVELTDDTLQFGLTPNSPGTLYQIQSIQPTDPSITLAVPPGQPILVDPSQNARLRRWDMSGPAVTATGIPLSPGSTTQLENGIEITFGPIPSGPGPVLAPPPIFHSGDYWTIPARTATGQIEWPPCGSDGNAFQPPVSVLVYSAPLACVHAAAPAPAGQSPNAPTVDDCRRLFSPLTDLTPPAPIEAVHVTGVSWVNDDVMTLDALIDNGLTITLDQAPTCPLSGANVIVTVELANAAAVDNINPPLKPVNPSDPVRAPLTNLRTVTLIDSPVTLNGRAITWQIPTASNEVQSVLLQNLNTYLYQGAPAQQWAKMRIRLLGQMIYATSGTGQIYLDGRALGQPGVRQDGVTPRLDLRLPSDSGLMTSDFEGWLYVTPILQATATVITPGAVTVVAGILGRITGVVLTGSSPPQPASPTAEIVVSYPPLEDTTVTIGLTNTDGSTNGVNTIVSIQSTATILSGQTSVTVPINVIGNPGANTTLNFNISATVGTTPLGEWLANGTFSVTGVAPLQLPGPVHTG